MSDNLVLPLSPSVKKGDKKKNKTKNDRKSIRKLYMTGDVEKLLRMVFRRAKLPKRTMRGISLKSVLVRRLKVPLKPGQSSREFLLSHGIVENALTKPLFEYADRDTPIPGISIGLVAEKFVWGLGVGRENQLDMLPEGRKTQLDKLPETEIAGVSCRWFPSAVSGDVFGDDGQRHHTQSTQLKNDILEWFGRIADGHERFYHGTDTQSAVYILKKGMRSEAMSPGADFGQAFYCTKLFDSAYDYAENSKIRLHDKGVIMAFDMPENFAEDAEVKTLVGEEWNKIVKIFHYHMYNLIDLDGWDLVVGPICGAEYLREGRNHGNPVAVGDDPQYAFKKQFGNKLLEVKANIKVAVFDIPTGHNGSTCTGFVNGEHEEDVER